MTKESLKNLIKECVKEVLNESLNDSSGEEQKPRGWGPCAVGYPGMTHGSSPRWAVCQDYTSKYLNKDGKWDKPMYAATFMSREEALAFGNESLGELKEDGAVGGGTGMGMSVTGAVQGYMTPKAFGKKKLKEVDWHDEESYKRSQGDTFDPEDEYKTDQDLAKSKPTAEHFINGQSNQVAAKRVNKLLSVLSKGMFSDQSWEGINRIFSKLKEAGIEVELIKTEYGGQADSQTGMPTFKQWNISIPFTNNKGKQVNLVGQITAHGAGSVEDPLDRYDIVAYVTPVAARRMSEEEQPEEYDAETDTFAPGPRSRPEDWKKGGITASDI